MQATRIENVSSDPTTYCDEILTEKVGNIWTRKGVEFFQNKNSDFQIQAVKQKVDI